MTRVLILLLAAFSVATAHELHSSIGHPAPGLVSVLALYGHDSPAKDTIVRVYRPGEEEPFQSGHTDQHGMFVFGPDQPGEWLVELDDEMGHQGHETVSIDASFTPIVPAQAAGSSWKDLVTGVSLLIGLAGGLVWWTSRRRAPEARPL